MRTYLAVMLIGNLVWEVLQLPLYAIWTTADAGRLTFAVLHCTFGDLLIALMAALIIAGNASWPREGFRRVAVSREKPKSPEHDPVPLERIMLWRPAAGVERVASEPAGLLRGAAS